MSRKKVAWQPGRATTPRVAESRREEFPNHFVGDLVQAEYGWVVVPPTAVCAAARSAVPTPQQRPRLDVGRRATRPALVSLWSSTLALSACVLIASMPF